MPIQLVRDHRRAGVTDARNEAEISPGAMSRLNAWQLRGAPSEQRDVAFQRIQLCAERGETSLDLSGLGLRAHPPVVPSVVETLDFSRNQLTQFTLSLPHNLKSLDVSDNKLRQFTAPLPPDLHDLDLSKNALRELTVELPAALDELNLSNNRFAESPATLPSSLNILDLRANSLQCFPTNIPPFLQGLDLRENPIIQLPVLPVCTLINIDGSILDSRSSERLAQYREDFRAYVEEPDFQFNHEGSTTNVTEVEAPPQTANAPLAEGWTRMGQQLSTVVDRVQESNTRSSAAPASIDISTNIPPISGNLAFLFTPHYRIQESNTHSAAAAATSAIPMNISLLGRSVAAWYPRERRAELIAAWDPIATETGVAKFREFLEKLGGSVNAKTERFKESVRTWLSRLPESRSLREATFRIALDASESCEDRASLSFNEMQKACTVEDVSNGKYDANLPELISVARVAYREERLEAIAQAKINEKIKEKLAYFDRNPALHRQFPGMDRDEIKDELRITLDAIGVHLFYRLHTLDQLGLSANIQEMRYPPHWIAMPEAADTAVSIIKAAENTEFPAWLSNWTPWEKVLERMNETEYDNAIENLYVQLGEPLQMKVQAALLAENITPDSPYYEDAYRNRGPVITREILNDIKIPLTMEFLAQQGFAGELAPFWK